MFYALIDGYIGVPESLYTMYNRRGWDNLTIGGDYARYLKGDKWVYPLSVDAPDFRDVFGEDGESYPTHARYLKTTDSGNAAWVVLDAQGKLWYYQYINGRGGVTKSREEINWDPNSRLFFPTTEMVVSHRDIITGAIAGGISKEGLSELVTTRCLGSASPLVWSHAGKLMYLIRSTRVTPTDWLDIWRNSEEGKQVHEQFANPDTDGAHTVPTTPIVPAFGDPIYNGMGMGDLGTESAEPTPEPKKKTA